MTSPTDAELLDGWRAGDTGRGGELYRRHFPAVHRYYANKLGTEREVEDLIQRTFLACVEGRDRFMGASAFRTWLLGIAHHLLCEYYRRARRRGEIVDLSAVSIKDLCDGPSTLLRQRRDQQVLLDALRTIPLDSQVVLELYYWEHFTGPELAEFLGVVENTARSRLRRAKALLLEAVCNDNDARALAGPDDLDAWAADVRAAAFEL